MSELKVAADHEWGGTLHSVDRVLFNSIDLSMLHLVSFNVTVPLVQIFQRVSILSGLLQTLT